MSNGNVSDRAARWVDGACAGERVSWPGTDGFRLFLLIGVSGLSVFAAPGAHAQAEPATAAAAPVARPQTEAVPAAAGVAPQADGAVPQAAPSAAPDAQSAGPVDEDIVVTARRQSESAMKIPESITAFGEQTLTRLNIQTFSDYATKVPNLGFSYGTNGYGFAASRTIAIRGISGAGTTATYIDDTPIPESVDPQVVDIQRIEVLKGPRGTLYGQGSLGGNIRLVTNRPSVTDDEFRFMAEGGVTRNGGSADYMANGVGNVVLVPDKIALRVVGFTSHDAGFYSRTFPAPAGSVRPSPISVNDQGASTTYGGSASLRFILSDHFTADLRIMGQDTRFNGYPAIDAPLPGFKPVGLVQNFPLDIQETSKDNWYLPSLELTYENDAVTVTSSTSFFSRNYGVVEDATQQMNDFFTVIGLPVKYGAQGDVWTSDFRNKTFNQEVRASFKGNDWIHGIIGARYANDRASGPLTTTDLTGLAASGAYSSDIVWYSNNATTSKDYSIFGEAYLTYANFELTLGLRKYWLRQNSSTFVEGFFVGGVSKDNTSARASGINPKVALSYKLPHDAMIYASASKGFRAGGTNPSLVASSLCAPGLAQLGVTASDLAQVNPDSVWNYEVGAKGRVGRLNVTGAVFQMDWKNIQQPLLIPFCNLSVGSNSGAARSRGAELEISGEVTRGLNLRLGFGYNDAKITKAGISQQLPGERIFQVPRITASGAADYSWQLNKALGAFVGADVSYTGDSVSNIAAGKPVRPSYTVTNARLGIRHGKIEIGLYARNLFDVRANLGDLNTLSFPKTDAAGNIIPRVVILPPRQVGVSLKYGF
jgi:outer membrane receptor protein involved in Fe transport